MNGNDHSPYDTITFDLWNTLIAHDEAYDGILKKVRIDGIWRGLRDTGIIIGRDVVESAYSTSEPILSKKWERHIDVDIGEQLDIYLRCMGMEPSDRLAAAIETPYTEAALKVKPFLVDGARDSIINIKEMGFKVALISNTGRTPGRTMRKVMAAFDILDLFDVTVFSNEAGYLKPHRAIFDAALAKVGTSPGKAIHVGDHAVLDVYGARIAGMKSVLVTRYSKGNDKGHVPDSCIESIDMLPEAVARLVK